MGLGNILAKHLNNIINMKFLLTVDWVRRKRKTFFPFHFILKGSCEINDSGLQDFLPMLTGCTFHDGCKQGIDQ